MMSAPSVDEVTPKRARDEGICQNEQNRPKDSQKQSEKRLPPGRTYCLFAMEIRIIFKFI